METGVPKKRGRKKKVQAEPPLPEASDSRDPSEISSTNGEIVNMKMETADVDVSVADDVSIQSLDDGKSSQSSQNVRPVKIHVASIGPHLTS